MIEFYLLFFHDLLVLCCLLLGFLMCLCSTIVSASSVSFISIIRELCPSPIGIASLFSRNRRLEGIGCISLLKGPQSHSSEQVDRRIEDRLCAKPSQVFSCLS